MIEIMDWFQIAIGSGALIYLGRIDQKIRFLCSRDRDHETRLRALEHTDPKSPDQVAAVLRRIDEA